MGLKRMQLSPPTGETLRTALAREIDTNDGKSWKARRNDA